MNLKIPILILLFALIAYKPVQFLLTPTHIKDFSHLIDTTPHTFDKIESVITSHHITLGSNVTLHVLEAGPKNGTLVIFLHGFPETALISWKHQIPHFANLGYRVVAPDQRCYNTSTTSSDPNVCNGIKAAEDVSELIDYYERKEAVVIGHDWGAMVAWYFATLYPHKLSKLVILNVPHPGTYEVAYKYSWDQYRKSWYIFFFQVRYIAEWKLRRDRYGYLKAAVLHLANPKSYTLEDLDRLEKAWSQPGALTGMLGWYRHAFQSIFGRRQFPLKKIEKPMIMIWGKKDLALDFALAKPSVEQWCTNGRLIAYDDASHFVQRDQPERVNAEIEKFLKE